MKRHTAFGQDPAFGLAVGVASFTHLGQAIFDLAATRIRNYLQLTDRIHQELWAPDQRFICSDQYHTHIEFRTYKLEYNNALFLMINELRKHYANALSSNDVVSRVLFVLKNNFNLSHEQIILADSICCDDVNSMEYPQDAYKMLGPFKLGGLNGFPFAGLTGLSAFAHHVPEGGGVYIFYAPHIGFSIDGTLGEIQRKGQTKNSSCCGAANQGLQNLMRNEIEPGNASELDYQQNTIEQIFYAQKQRILTSVHPLREATEVMYEAIEQRINTLVAQSNLAGEYIILLGGILINGDPSIGSFCEPRRFQVIDRKRKTSFDLLQEVIS